MTTIFLFLLIFQNFPFRLCKNRAKTNVCVFEGKVEKLKFSYGVFSPFLVLLLLLYLKVGRKVSMHIQKQENKWKCFARINRLETTLKFARIFNTKHSFLLKYDYTRNFLFYRSNLTYFRIWTKVAENTTGHSKMEVLQINYVSIMHIYHLGERLMGFPGEIYTDPLYLFGKSVQFVCELQEGTKRQSQFV